jgi:hypothetical protein
MKSKSPILPERIRRISGSFSWLDHRLLHSGFLRLMQPEEMLLYFFLVLVGDKNGVKEIPIEHRDPDEIKFVHGLDEDGLTSVLICPQTSQAANFAFDVTPANLVAGLITEKGICQATEADIRRLFPYKNR